MKTNLFALACLVIQSLSLELYSMDTEMPIEIEGDANYEFSVYVLASGARYADAERLEDSDMKLIMSSSRFLDAHPSNKINEQYAICVEKRARDRVQTEVPEGLFEAIQQFNLDVVKLYGISQQDFYTFMVAGVASQQVSPERFLQLYPEWKAREDRKDNKRTREEEDSAPRKQLKKSSRKGVRNPETLKCLAAVEKFLNNKLSQPDCEPVKMAALLKEYNVSPFKYQILKESTFRTRVAELCKDTFTREECQRFFLQNSR